MFTWFILAFNLVLFLRVVTAIAAHGRSCDGLGGDALTNCEAGNAGHGAAVMLLIVFCALGDLALLMLWRITRPRTRDCPVCGHGVPRGLTRCRDCGYDFRQADSRGAGRDWGG